MSRNARIGMIVVLAFGVFLRAFHIDIFEFKADELEGIQRGLAADAQHWWILHGSTASVKIPFGPTFPYIMGLFTAFSPAPYTLTCFIVAANVVILLLAVLFFADFSKGVKQFLLSVFLFSFSPYMIILSRKIWQPSIVLLFAIPLVLMVRRMRLSPRLFVPIGLLSSILVQLHHSGIVYVPILISLAVLGALGPGEGRAERPPGFLKGRSSFLWAAGGLATFILTVSPYLSFLLMHFRKTGITQWVEKAPYHTCFQGALKWVLFSPTGTGFWRFATSGKVGDWGWPFAPFPGIILFFSYFLIIPFVFGLYRYAKSAGLLFGRKSHDPAVRFDPGDLLCAGSILFLFMIYCCVLQTGRPHHYAIILPFLILALSDGIISLTTAVKAENTGTGAGKEARAGDISRYGSAVRVFLCVGLISYVLQYPFIFFYVEANNGSRGEYGISFREQRRAAEKLAAISDGGQIRVSPLEGVPEPHRKELQNTIAYICKIEFGREVLFNAPPGSGAKVLRLIETGRRLHFEIGE